MSLGNVWMGSMAAKTLTGQQALNAGVLTMITTALSVLSVVDRVVVHLGGATTETLTISLNPVDGANFNTVIYRVSTSGFTSFFYQPDRPLFLYPGDQLNVNVSNGNAAAVTVYASILTLY